MPIRTLIVVISLSALGVFLGLRKSNEPANNFATGQKGDAEVVGTTVNTHVQSPDEKSGVSFDRKDDSSPAESSLLGLKKVLPEPDSTKSRSIESIIDELLKLPMGLDGLGPFEEKIREIADTDLIAAFDFLGSTADFPKDWTSTTAANLILHNESKMISAEVITFLTESSRGQKILATDPLLMGEFFRTWHEADPKAAIDALSQMPDSMYRSAMKSTIVMNTLFSDSPETALEMALAHGSKSGEWTAFSNVARLSAKSDPQRFAEKLASISNNFSEDSNNQFSITAEVFTHAWARRDLEAALAWIDQCPPKMRDQLIKNEWPRIAEWDRASALSWISSVSDENLKNALTKKASQREQ